MFRASCIIRNRRDQNLWPIIICLGLSLTGCQAARPVTHPTDAPTPVIRLTNVIPADETPADEVYAQLRLDMVTFTIEARGVQDADVLRVMRSVPRHAFVPPEYMGQAYEDHPLPIGYGQTISQPYIVAWMTELLELQPGERVLEIGTGSGYQAVVLAELDDVEVYSIEIIPELAEQAAARLHRLGYDAIHLKQGDGYYGWEEHAPFDAIIVTAAPDHLPQPLVDQLVDEGRIVVPIGPPGSYQTLWKFVKQGSDLKAYNLGAVAFVPLTGAETNLEPPTAAP
jgi:protein-L-isoaspartate(D-aspartate) O-methyltransferase